MRLGLFLNTPPNWTPTHRFETVMEMAIAAERHGFDVVVAPQHYADTNQRLLQPIPLLGRLSGAVSRVRLGTGIMLAGLLNPYEVAESLATLDVMSGGRALLGVGAGHQPAELRCFGVERRERGQRLEACISTVRALWGVTPLAPGAAPISLAPVDPAGVPVWVAGTSDAGVRRAARIGDAWYVGPGTKLPTLRRQAGVYRAELDRLARPMPTVLPVRRDVFLTVDRAERRELPNVLRRRYQAQAASGYQDDLPSRDRETRAGMTRTDDAWHRLIGEEVIAGDIDECRSQLGAVGEQVRAEGAQALVVVRVAWPGIDRVRLLEQLDAIGELSGHLAAA